MLMVDAKCPKCEHILVDALIRAGESYPPCPECGTTTARVFIPGSASAVHGDDIPGGLEITNALCHADGTPRKFYSKSEIARAAKEAGWSNYVRHVGTKGGDKSKHTQRFI